MLFAVLLHFQLFVLIVATAEKINVTEAAFAITQKNCDILQNKFAGAPIMFAAAHLVVVGRTKQVGQKTYGDGNTKFEISMTPHCILKGNTNQKTLTVRNMGKGDCGATNVEKNDLVPYLFFLRATPDPKVFEALNLGAKRIPDSTMLWSPVLTMFCGVTNKKTCSGDLCAKACNFSPPAPGHCIVYKNDVIEKIKEEQTKMKAMTTTEAPKVAISTKTPSSKNESPPEKSDAKTSSKNEMGPSSPKMTEEPVTTMNQTRLVTVYIKDTGKSVPYDPNVNGTTGTSVEAATNVKGPRNAGFLVSVNCFVLILALGVSWLM